MLGDTSLLGMAHNAEYGNVETKHKTFLTINNVTKIHEIYKLCNWIVFRFNIHKMAADKSFWLIN